MCPRLPIENFALHTAGTILMEVPASFLRGGTSRSQYQNRSRASALCILWRILHFGRSWGHSKNYNMVLDLQELGLRFLVPMTSIFVNSQKNLLTFGDVGMS